MSWSIIVPQAGTNRAGNPSAEEDASTAIALLGVGTACVRSDAQARWGAYSFAVTPAAAGYAGLLQTITGCTPGTTYVFSVWVRGVATIPYRIYFGAADGSVKAGCTPTTFTGGGVWQRYEVIFVADGAVLYACVSKNSSASAATFYVDGWQVEVGAAATTYLDGEQPGCEWNGVPHLSTATRAAQEGGGGTIVNLAAYGINVSHNIGLGMPPLRHKRLDTPNLPGALLEDIHVEPRSITLACWSNAANDASDDSALNLARAQLLNALKLDRVATLQPVTLRHASATRTFELHCFYDGGLERNLTEYRFEAFALRLICYDPFLYEIGEVATALDVEDTATFRYVCARRRATGQWDALGPPATGDFVYTVCVANDGTIFVGGAFTGWHAQAGWDYLVKWENGVWARVGGASAFNASVRALCMSPNPRILYIGGLFTNAGGATGDYVAQYNMDGNTVTPLGGGGTGIVYALALAPNGDLYVGGDFANWDGLGAGDNIVVWDLSAGDWAAVGQGLDSIVRALVVAPFTGHLYAGGDFANDGTPTAMRCVANWDGTAWAEVGGGLDNGGGTGRVYALACDAAGNLYAGGIFTQTDDGLLTGLSNIACYDGNCWQALGPGCDDTVYGLALGPDGLVHAGGDFNAAGDVSSRHYARWNGYSWMLPDVLLPIGIVYAVACGRPDPRIAENYDVILGFSVAGAALFAGGATAQNGGTAQAYPYLRLESTGGTSSELRTIRNETTGRELAFAGLYLLDGETIIVDLRPGRRGIRSDRRSNLLGYLRRPSDLARWALQPGVNLITCLVARVGGPTVTAHLLWTRTDWSVDSA
jgi:hypothetical protein